MTLPDSLLVALQFLTRLPVPLKRWPQEAEIGRSLLWYPFTGALIGVLLIIAAWVLQGLGVAPMVLAVLLLVLWVALTGGLHLDGLADTADAWAGGAGDRERTLALMKDPRCGSMAVVGLVLLLLAKFAALVTLLQQDSLLFLLLPPLLGRMALLLLFLGTRYVREEGLGSVLARHRPLEQGWSLLLAWLLPVLLFGIDGLLALLAAALVFVLWRRSLLQRLGGTTGDTAGAMVELVEVAVILVLVC